MRVIKSFSDFELEPTPSINMNPPSDNIGPMAGGAITLYDDTEDPELEPEEDEELEEGKDPYAITSKDTMRIQDIHDKANGDKFRMRRLAETMCKLITDASKATRRALAAEQLKFYDLAELFFARARELNGAA
jgi:hypothetical protein